MDIRTGIDIVHIPRFKKTYLNGGETFSKLIFTPDEAEDSRIEHLAGIYALKEALIKCSLIGIGGMRNVEVRKDKNGKPDVVILNSSNDWDNKTISVSISHDGDYAIAIAVVMIKD